MVCSTCTDTVSNLDTLDSLLRLCRCGFPATCDTLLASVTSAPDTQQQRGYLMLQGPAVSGMGRKHTACKGSRQMDGLHTQLPSAACLL